jgi:hypothetical protein
MPTKYLSHSRLLQKKAPNRYSHLSQSFFLSLIFVVYRHAQRGGPPPPPQTNTPKTTNTPKKIPTQNTPRAINIFNLTPKLISLKYSRVGYRTEGT